MEAELPKPRLLTFDRGGRCRCQCR